VKRFTETEKWTDFWFRRLTPAAKLLWFYLIDNCDNAGFLEFDPDLCAFTTGLGVSQVESALGELSDRVRTGRDGYIYLMNFLRHQKNDALNPMNNAHKQIIGIIKKNAGRFDGEDAEHLHSLVQDASVEYSAEFLEFWAAYPKRIGKDAAFEAYRKAISRVTHGELVRAVRAQAQGTEWTREGGRFIPRPAAWLDDGRWQDELNGGTTDDLPDYI
jgi:hypothetical protein